MFTSIYGLSDPRNNEIRYVGKSNNPRSRFRNHIHDERPTHKVSWIKQLAKIGLSPSLTILETVLKTRWQEQERWWITELRSRGMRLTNLSDGGAGPTILADHIRQQISVRVAATPRTKIWRERIGKSRMGHQLSESARLKISQSRANQWIIEQPDSNRLLISNLNAFCSANNLSITMLRRVANGTHGNYRGWRCFRVDLQGNPVIIECLNKVLPPKRQYVPKIRIRSAHCIELHRKKLARHWLVRSPDGVESEIFNLALFCASHDLNPSSMCNVSRGRQLHHHGWTCNKVI